jgi:uncharacterized protein YfdQ (DUF2303 family)
VEKSAIVQIQESANIPALISQLNDMNTNKPVIVTPENFKLVNLESYMPNRAGYRFQLKTDSLTDYIQYAKEYDKDGAKCFINAKNMSAQSIFDLGTEKAPLHQEHTATLTLEKTGPYSALLNVNGAQLSQKEASEFIEDWSEQLKVSNSADTEMATSIAAKRLRDLTIEAAREVNSKVSDFGESMSAIEKMEAKGQDSLPATMYFTCTPYIDLQEYKFELRVGILAGGDKPKIVFRIVRLELVQEQITNEFKSKIVEGFKGSKLKTFIGSMR